MKRLAGILLSLVLLVTTIFIGCESNKKDENQTPIQKTSDKSNTTEKKPGDLNGEITIWEYSSELMKKIVEGFNQVYPNIKVSTVPVDGSAYDQKLQTTLSAGGELPDIIWLNYFQRGKLHSLDILENLEADPYNVDRSKILDWVVDLGSNERGELVSIETGPAPTGIVYRRDIVKEYLGTDDPEELGNMFKDFDTFIEKIKVIKEKSNDEILPFSSIGDAYTILDGITSVPYIKNGNLNIMEVCNTVFPKLEAMVNDGLVGKIDQWSPAYNASFASGKYAFGICPMWAPDYLIKPNAEGESGKFGVIAPPGGKMFNFGGTSNGIWKDSKNKELAWEYMRWTLLTVEGQKLMSEAGGGGIGPLKEPYQIEGFYSKPDEFFGGQDLSKFWAENINNVSVRLLTKNDSIFGSAMGLGVSAIKTGLNAEKAAKKVEDEVILKLPEFKK